MAAIGKIRSWGPWLVGIIGLALFGFIATDFTRSCETSSNQARQQVGEVMGSKLSIQDYQSKVEDLKNVVQFIGQDIDEEQLRDIAWNEFVQSSIIAEEAEKLGLGVSDQELKSVLTGGVHPVLRTLPLLREFFNQQTGAFDYNNVTQIYAMLQQSAPDQFAEFDRYWKTIEQMLRENLLSQKYQSLLKACMLSNDASAKMAFDASNSETTIELASIPYSSINDNDVTIDDKDLSAKYAEMKEQFKWNRETRDISYVVCNIAPSETDINNLRNGLLEAAEQLGADSIAQSDIVAMHRSTIGYHDGLPYNAEGLRNISPVLFAAIDSMADKQVTAPVSFTTMRSGKPVENMAVVKLNRKYQAVDSVNFKYLPVGGQTLEAAVKTADSIVAAIKGGQPFDSVAAHMGQTANEQWSSAHDYQNLESISPDVRTVNNTVHNAELNQPQTLQLSGGVLVINVIERRPATTLYDVAIVNNEVRFSNDTYENTYNQFSQYVSECSTPEDLEKNAAKYNYIVMNQENLENDAHNIGSGQQLASTREAVKWAFAKASVGKISEIYQNSSEGRLLVVALTKIHPVGYLDQQSVESQLRAEVLKDKKAEKLMQKLAGITSVAAAVEKGAVADTIRRISFPTAVSVKGIRERGLSGAVAAVQPGETSKQVIKGANGVYFFKVIDRQDKGRQFDAREQEASQVRNAIMNVTPSQYSPYTNISDILSLKAKVQDNRYMF